MIFVLLIPEIIDRIYEDYFRRGSAEDPRPHLGASMLGKKCARALWFEFRWVGSFFEGRLYRLFDTGKLEEPRLKRDLRRAGIKFGRIPASKPLYGFIDGTPDEVGTGFPEAPKKRHVVEFKTHSEWSFKSLVSKGVREAKREHYIQVQVYMHLKKIDRAIYLARNKNTDELYYERIKYEKEVAEEAIERARQILFAPRPEKALSKSDPECRYCSFRRVCHEGGSPRRTCRSCIHATPSPDGRFRCERHNRDLPYRAQLEGCGDHLFVPDTLPYGEPIEASEEGVTYRDAGGNLIINERGGTFRRVYATDSGSDSSSA